MVLVDTLRKPREDAALSEQEARIVTIPVVPSTSSSVVADGFFWSSRLPQFARFQRLSALIDRFSRLGRSYPPTSQSELCGNDRQPRYTWTGRSRARCDCERPTHDGTDRPEQDREGEHRSGRRKPFVPRPGPRRRPAALAAARRAKRSAVVSAFDIAAFHDVLEKIAGIVGHADAFISCDPGVSLRS